MMLSILFCLGLLAVGAPAVAGCAFRLDGSIAIAAAMPRVDLREMPDAASLFTPDRSAVVVTDGARDVLLVVDRNRIQRDGLARLLTPGLADPAAPETAAWLARTEDQLRAYDDEEPVASNVTDAWTDPSTRQMIDEALGVRVYGRLAVISLRLAPAASNLLAGMNAEPSVRGILYKILVQPPRTERANYVLWDVAGVPAPRVMGSSNWTTKTNHHSASPAWFEEQVVSTIRAKARVSDSNVVYLPYPDVTMTQTRTPRIPAAFLYEVRLSLEANAFFYRVTREVRVTFAELMRVIANFNRRSLEPARPVEAALPVGMPPVWLPESHLETSAHGSINPTSVPMGLELMLENCPGLGETLRRLPRGRQVAASVDDVVRRNGLIRRQAIFYRGEDDRVFILAYLARLVRLPNSRSAR